MDGMTKDAREPEINTALDRQEREIANLYENIERAFNRFSKVLRGEPTSGVEDKNKPMDSTVPLVNDILSKTERIREANLKLNNLSDLCEL